MRRRSSRVLPPLARAMEESSKKVVVWSTYPGSLFCIKKWELFFPTLHAYSLKWIRNIFQQCKSLLIILLVIVFPDSSADFFLFFLH